MQQKVIQVGNSLAVTLPIGFVKSKKIRAGQIISVDANAQLDLVEIRTKISDKPHLTTEFKEWLDMISEKYKEAIKVLATK
jgi:antitoxin component of MazEF toxin-antitoxin module